MAERMLKVRATKRGHYLHYRREGDEFQIPERLFSDTWMVDLSKEREATKVKTAPGKGADGAGGAGSGETGGDGGGGASNAT